MQTPTGLTLPEFAAAKRLPVPFLEVQGIRQVSYLGKPALRFSYTRDGQEVAVRIRTAMTGGARFEGEEHRLEVRLAWHEGAIWYDIGDWRAVRVSALGCEAIEQPPILFRHFAHQKPQAEPAQGGDLRQLLGLLNLTALRQQLLLLVYLVVSLVPDIPRPVLVVCGG